jgi:hypothetical protein
MALKELSLSTRSQRKIRYIGVPENIIGVVNLFSLGSSITASTGMFNVQYQFVLNNIHDMAGDTYGALCYLFKKKQN